jgi:rhodanese-related sulfurtransferase
MEIMRIPFVITLFVVSQCVFYQPTIQGESMECGSQCSTSYAKEASSSTTTNKVGKIDTAGLEVLISSGVPFVIIDARGGQWDDGKRIAGAQNLTSEASAEEIAEVIPSKTTLVVVYCSNAKCQASTRLVNHLVALGYSNVLKYEEGIEEWVKTGHQVD